MSNEQSYENIKEDFGDALRKTAEDESKVHDLKLLKQAIISKIHGLPWEEARWVDSTGHTLDQLREELKPVENNYGAINSNVKSIDGETIYHALDDDTIYKLGWNRDREYVPKGQPITLSRVFVALEKVGLLSFDCLDFEGNDLIVTFINPRIAITWKLLNKDKSTATLEDQNKKTMLALTKIFL